MLLTTDHGRSAKTSSFRPAFDVALTGHPEHDIARTLGTVDGLVSVSQTTWGFGLFGRLGQACSGVAE